MTAKSVFLAVDMSTSGPSPASGGLGPASTLLHAGVGQQGGPPGGPPPARSNSPWSCGIGMWLFRLIQMLICLFVVLKAFYGWINKVWKRIKINLVLLCKSPDLNKEQSKVYPDVSKAAGVEGSQMVLTSESKDPKQLPPELMHLLKPPSI